MHSRAELYRRRGIQAKQPAAQANQPNIKDAFEQVARDWFALAEQVEWLEGHYRALAFGEPRDRSQNRPGRDLSRRQRPDVTHLNPRKCPQIAGYLSGS